MALYDRLLGYEAPFLPVHQFMGMLGELKRGKVTQAQIVAALGLSVAEETELVTLAGKLIQRTEFVTLGSYNPLTNVGLTYDAINSSRGLGFVRIDMTGVTTLDIEVQCNKIGSGIQSWQLWNETDASQIAVINDAGAAGNKTLTTSVTGLTLVGVKRIRLRSLSTVTTDDPIHYGTSIQVHRIDTLMSAELHEVLLIGEAKQAPYNTVASVKTRLGV